jgi:hypothetical protein
MSADKAVRNLGELFVDKQPIGSAAASLPGRLGLAGPASLTGDVSLKGEPRGFWLGK